VQYDWDMDNDSTFEITTRADAERQLSQRRLIHRRRAVTDDDGATDETTASVDVNNPPWRRWRLRAAGVLPLDVLWTLPPPRTATARSCSTTGTWTTTACLRSPTAADAERELPGFGSFTVGVRVTDDDGATDTATASVTVQSPPVAT